MNERTRSHPAGTRTDQTVNESLLVAAIDANHLPDLPNQVECRFGACIHVYANTKRITCVPVSCVCACY